MSSGRSRLPPAATMCAASCGISCHRAVHAGYDGAVAGLQIVPAARRPGRSARPRRPRHARPGAAEAPDWPGTDWRRRPSWSPGLHVWQDTGTISARWKQGQAKAGGESRAVLVLATSNDPVRLSFLTALLADAGIEAIRAGCTHQRGGGQHWCDPAPAGGGGQGREASAAGAGGGGRDLKFRAHREAMSLALTDVLR